MKLFKKSIFQEGFIIQISEQITQKIIAIVRSTINFDEEIHPSVNLIEYGADSMKQMEILVKIEMEFNFEFADEDLLMTNFENINKIVFLLEQKYSCSIRGELRD
ncbi:acyl carrier protein [Paenibacillus tritici]|uniref:acyl carrier protein n=1 Tax=Paenibacillus tritici TaxID=1873425 RepID=UPI001BAD653E|nr:acyl carrier protein [Paenibacillus tritici]